ncbi:MAG: hypothetical protein IT237_06230 [Bacteroidia bacterium]|nr:hypothetical protein [Bacteroidia bacterium]
MKKLTQFILAAGLLVSVSANAQKWTTGKDLSYLKGQKEILIKYDFSNMTVGRKQAEAEYVKEKTEDYNKKEAGKGDTWAKAWVENRERVFYPKFEELFSKEAGEVIAGGRDKASAKYTLIVHTTKTEPGFNIGLTKQPAYCDFEISIVETADPSKVLSVGVLKNVPGSQFSGFDFDASTRISECYAKAGKTIGKTIKKAAKQ